MDKPYVDIETTDKYIIREFELVIFSFINIINALHHIKDQSPQIANFGLDINLQHDKPS